MSAFLVFENTVMAQAGHDGVLRPNANGLYEVNMGAFDITNSAGAYYSTDGVRDLFASSSELMRRVSQGQLYGEWGHPKRDPGMTDRDYLIKLLIMHEEQISHHIAKIELHENYKLPDGRTCLAVIGHVRPFGPRAAMVEQGLSTPDMNLCFSLRSISIDAPNNMGQIVKKVVKIVTWDGVLEPGIQLANKYDTKPSVESRHIFSLTDIEAAVEQAYSQSQLVPAMESAAHDLERLGDELRKGRLRTQDMTAVGISRLIKKNNLSGWAR